MARIPTYEETLLEINQSLGLERPQSKYIKQFSDLGMSLDKHREMAEQLLGSIMSALDMDEQAQTDPRLHVLGWASFHKALELHTWTGNASPQQVLWHLLAYSYVPTLARGAAFWSLEGVPQDQAFDAGMPGGKLWFLPNWGKGNNKIKLPVPLVIDWVLDLIGEQPLEKSFGDELRKLQGWRLEGRLPKSAREIDELFGDDSELEFLGAIRRDEEALAFVERKGLNATTSWDKIPMTPERLAPILNESAPENEKQEFARLIAIRYAEPSMRIIRQRLKVARMVQDGYQRLLKFLCAEVDATCADPAQNKLMQLITLFQDVYSLTIAAYKNGGNHEEQDAWFEAQLPPWDSMDLLLSILPSQQETACMDLAQRLTRRFMALEEGQSLEDFVPLSEEDAGPIIERRMLRLEREHEEDLRLEKLVDRVRTASPWRALQAEDNYRVVSQLVLQEDLSPKARDMAAQRMRDLATTPGQTVGTILIELGFHLNCEPKLRPKDVRNLVQTLLDEAEASPGFEEWKAPLLRFRAKHRLMQNDFEDAREDFEAALDACSERGFGMLRGEIARDGWATEIAEHGFVPKRQEKHYRNMLWYGVFPGGVESVEDAAVWCEKFFWADLYHPYPDFKREDGPATLEFEAALEETFALIERADWEGLQTWMQCRAKAFRKTNLRDARRNSVLLAWLKLLHMFEGTLPYGRAMPPPEFSGELGKVERHMVNWREAIRLLLEAWPEQATIADFKGQTPLMLVAENGDAKLTGLLAPISDVDAQDSLGRTALHAAVVGRSPKCVAIVLDRNPYVADKVTDGEENTALHTAVRFGVPENVRQILEAFPSLALKTNASGKTPMEMACGILGDLSGWRELMRKQKRETGSKEDFETIIVLLEHESPKAH